MLRPQDAVSGPTACARNPCVLSLLRLSPERPAIGMAARPNKLVRKVQKARAWGVGSNAFRATSVPLVRAFFNSLCRGNLSLVRAD